MGASTAARADAAQRSAMSRVWPQPAIALATDMAALAALSLTYGAASRPFEPISVTIVALYLMAAVIVATQFPIHIQHSTKLYVSSAPLYLLAVLLPPPVAGAAAGLAKLASDLLTRNQRGSYTSDIATTTGRWVLIALAASMLAHVQMGAATLRDVPVVLAAAAMLAADMVTAPLVLSPITGLRPDRMVLMLIRRAGVPEAVQYFVAVMIAIAALHSPWTLAMLPVPVALVWWTYKRSNEVDEGTRQFLERMADTVDLRDPYTGGHSRRVADLCASILDELGYHGPEVNLIVSAARVHDIGKIGIPDDVLNKDGKLSEEEWAVMQTHPALGADLLSRYPEFARGADIVRHHHERWDGLGYPNRLRAADIPFGARVIAVADSFDAMTSDRPYRRGMTVEQAVSILSEGRGVQWDPMVVDAMLRTDQAQSPLSAVPLRLIKGGSEGAASA